MSTAGERPERLRRFRPYPTYKNSGVGWLGDIPRAWNVIRNLGLFFDRREKGFANLPIYSVTQRNGLIPQDEVTTKIVNASDNKDGYKRIHPGDLVYNKMRMWQGAIGTSPATAIVSPAYVVCSSRCEIQPRFFEYLYRTPVFVTESGRHSYGICDDMNSLRFDDFKGIYSIVPPLREQQAIAEFLDQETGKIDALVAQKERLIKLLQEKRTALITHAITKGLDPTASTKPSCVDWLGDIPAHWDATPLLHCVDPTAPIVYGILLPGPRLDEGVPYIGAGDVTLKKLKRDLLPRTTEEISAEYQRSLVKTGELVYAIRGSFGAVEVVPEELDGVNLSRDAARISPARDINKDWLCWALKAESSQGYFVYYGIGAAVTGVNIRDLKKVPLPLPPKAEQEAIAGFLANRVGGLERLLERVSEGVDRLGEFRTALISAAITGKIDVREKVA